MNLWIDFSVSALDKNVKILIGILSGAICLFNCCHYYVVETELEHQYLYFDGILEPSRFEYLEVDAKTGRYIMKINEERTVTYTVAISDNRSDLTLDELI